VSHPFTIINAPQRSEAWHQARLGLLTGSRAEDAIKIARTPGAEAAARRDYRMELVIERITGQPQEDGYVNAAMQWGIDKEDAAIAAYEAATGNVVQRTGFLRSLTDMAGCSLDGHIGDFEGIVEAKCPKSATHLKNLQNAGLRHEYWPQVMHALFVTGAQWCDFVSFDDRFPPPLRLHIVRFERVEEAVKTYAMKARAFLAEVQREVEVVHTLAGIGPVLQKVIDDGI
jgi:predicted phage-related endonuclease